MHLVLLLIGVVLAAAGAAMLRQAMPVEDMAGAAWFVSGVTAIVGALMIGALALVARNLSRIAERLEIQPLPVPPVAAVERDDPAPRPAKTAVAAAAGVARPSLLGWLGRGAAAPSRSAGAAAPVTPAEAPTAPVDLAPLTRVAEPAASLPPATPAVRATPRPSLPQNPTPANTVYRSGVIDGMAYTLFMDGSIQAELPQGIVKFANIDELQKYLLGTR
jgi:hypothetical protein